MSEPPAPVPGQSDPGEDVLPIPWLRRTAFAIYVLVVLCVITGLLITVLLQGYWSIPCIPLPPRETM